MNNLPNLALAIVMAILANLTTCAAAPSAVPLGAYSQSLTAPARIATDNSGNAYVVDPAANSVLVFDPFGRLTATHSGLARPLGIAVDAQNRVYLGEEQNSSVSVLDANWNLLYKLGAGNGEFALPGHIALDPASNTVYVSDSKANTIKVYAGAALINQFGTYGANTAQFDFPAGITVSPGGEVFVVDQNNDRVQVFNRTGTFLRQKSFQTGASPAPTGRRNGIVVDNAGRLLIAESIQGVIGVHDASNGALQGVIGSFGPLPGQLSMPVAAALDPFNRLLVASANNGRVELFGLDTYLHLTATPSALNVAGGTNLILAATPGGAGSFSFQWQHNSVNLTDGGNITGSTGTVLVVAGVSGADSGSYSVIISGPSGIITSGVAQVTVVTPPGILSGPYSPVVLRGETVNLTVTATGADLAYQWFHKTLPLPGATNSTLTLTDVQPANAGDYLVTVRNAVGTLTDTATLTVLSPPLIMEFLGIFSLAGQPPTLTINADPGANYSIDVSDDLISWNPLFSFPNDAGIQELTDPDVTNAPLRFYRLRWLP